jgi:hypothetical protein
LDVSEINKLLEEAGHEQKPYFGKRTISASIVGAECDAEIALKFRSFPQREPGPKATRIFKLGHLIEPLVIDYLIAAGIPVIPFADRNGYKQFTWTDYHGHAKVKVDGLIKWHDKPTEILEVKSAKESSYSGMRDAGIKVANPKYYAQAQMAMGLSGYKSVLMVVYCKNTSQLFSERLEFDEEYWAFLKVKIERILEGGAQKITKKEGDFRCMFCDVAGACWKAERPAIRHCHHCVFAHPDVGQKWWCMKHDQFAHAICDDFAFFEPQT